MTNLKEEFWDRIEDVRVGMMQAGESRAVPMAHHVDDDDDAHGNALWFVTAKDTDLARAAATGSAAQYTVTSDGEGLYARIDGTVSLSTNKDQLDEIWNVFTAAWFKGGKDDPNVQLVRFDLEKPEVWATKGKIEFLYEVAKANLTDETADGGDHGNITFHSH